MEKLVIPQSLLDAKGIDTFSQWVRDQWRIQSTAMQQEIAGHNALATERLVRRNVSHQKLMTWIQGTQGVHHRTRDEIRTAAGMEGDAPGRCSNVSGH